jgi:serine/threonine protein phosphatase PrpC
MAGPPPAEAAPAVPNETASAAATVPLPVEPPAFAALPVGALLDNRRYEVTDVISEGTKLNAYRVADYGGVHCPQCGSGDNAPNESFCASCGATLPPGPATYLLRETCEPDIWEGEKVLIERRLWHKGLVNVDRLFVERPYGNVQRFYLVSEQEEGESLAALPRPQTEDKVLLWGKDLAEAVAYLNDAGIRHGGIRAASVRLVNDQVKLTNFGRAEKVRSRIEGKDWPVEEVAELAHMLRDDLLAGQTLSPQAAAVFEKALSADKTVRYPSGNALAEDIGKALQASQRIESVTLFVGRYSHVGAVRDHNEDCLLTLEIQRVQLSESRPLGLYLVADGMGGHEAGDIASSLAVNAAARVVANKLILPWVDNQTPLDYEQLLKEAFQQANQAVNERRLKARTDMGTTLVGALVVGMDAFVANIGDSRCYCLSGGKLQQITTDHSLVERMVATKQITRAEARVHPQRNYIYRTVGDKPQVEVDTFKVSLKPGDYLVSCSDGLNSMIEDEQIQQAVLESPHPQAACERLVQLANEAGGDDNVTVIVLQALESKKQGRETP